MEEHYFVHHEGGRFVCSHDSCQESFKSKKGLRNHAASHRNGEPIAEPPPPPPNIQPIVPAEAPIASRTRKTHPL